MTNSPSLAVDFDSITSLFTCVLAEQRCTLSDKELSHLLAALNMQPDRVRQLAPVLLPDRSILIVVYCSRTCAASAQTAQHLAAMGYMHVVVFLGGKEEWVEAGLPVERIDS